MLGDEAGDCGLQAVDRVEHAVLEPEAQKLAALFRASGLPKTRTSQAKHPPLQAHHHPHSDAPIPVRKYPFQRPLRDTVFRLAFEMRPRFRLHQFLFGG